MAPDASSQTAGRHSGMATGGGPDRPAAVVLPVRTCPWPGSSRQLRGFRRCAVPPLRTDRASHRVRPSIRPPTGCGFRAAHGTCESAIMAARLEGKQVTDLDYGRFEALTFDCYGTLIDWETGILAGLRAAVATRGVEPPDDELLEAFARVEVEARRRTLPALPRDPRTLPARGRRRLRGSARPRRGGRVLRFGRRLAGLPRFGRRRWRASTSGSGSVSSPTAMTTCSPDRRRDSRRRSTGS